MCIITNNYISMSDGIFPATSLCSDSQKLYQRRLIEALVSNDQRLGVQPLRPRLALRKMGGSGLIGKVRSCFPGNFAQYRRKQSPEYLYSLMLLVNVGHLCCNILCNQLNSQHLSQQTRRWHNVGLMLAHLLAHWPYCLLWSQQTQNDVGSMLV